MPYQFPTVPEDLTSSYLILWDGECGFCRLSVEWLMKKAPGNLLALPYQQQSVWLPLEVFADCQNQFYLRTPEEKYLAGGDALIFLLNLMGWKTLSCILGLPGFRQLTGFAYRLVSRNRSFFSRILFRQK